MSDNVVHLSRKGKDRAPLPFVNLDDPKLKLDGDKLNDRRLRTFDNGFVPIRAHHKQPMVKGWNTEEVSPREIESWHNRRATRTRFPTTNLRVEKGLATIDLDIHEQDLVDAMIDCIGQIAPQLDAALARGRDDGSPKLMLFCRRAGEPFSMRTRKWIDPQGRKHQIEIFASEYSKTGHVIRQVGAMGAHTVDEKGNVVVAYAWEDDKTPENTKLADLPTLNEDEGLAVMVEFDRLMYGANFAPAPGRSSKMLPRKVYDLKPEMWFVGEDFAGNLAELSERYWIDQAVGDDTRICASFVDGIDHQNMTRCWVGWSGSRAEGCVCITDFGTEATHFPKDREPRPVDVSGDFSEILRLYDRQPSDDDLFREKLNSAIGIVMLGHVSERALATAWVTMLDDRFKYDGNSWSRFDGPHWDRNKATVNDLVHVIGRLNASIPLGGAPAAVAREGKRILSARTIGGVERLMRGPCTIDPKLFDADHWLAAGGDVVVDLKTGAVRPGKPEDMITKRWLCAPADDEDCPQWRKFVSEISCGDREIELFLQQFAGLALTGDPSHQKLAVFHGAGGNGKNVFIDTLAAVCGDYAYKADLTLLVATRGDKHPTDVWSLRGRRLVVASEVDENATWDTTRIMALTGDATITARGISRDMETFERTWSLIVVVNNPPRLRNVDDAVRRRLRIIPFDYTVPEGAIDPELTVKLIGEAPGILRWAINGLRDALANGLINPQRSIEATQEYLEGEDAVRAFVEAELEIGDPAWSVRNMEAFKRWQEFARGNGIEARRPQDLIRRMKKVVGPHRLRDDTKTGKFWEGIRIRPVSWEGLNGPIVDAGRR
jgi:P4 family phage/plasmid primase-like protien